MKLHLILWLLLGILFITHCQAQEMEAAEGGEGEDGEDDGELDPALFENEHDQEGDDGGEEEDLEHEGFDPLTSEQIRSLHKKIDANGNGQVSMAEITDYAHNMRRAIAQMELNDIMTSKDTDKDGKLNFDEFLGDPGKVPEEEQNERVTEFKELDIDSDKFLDADELASVYHHHINDKVEHTLATIAMNDKDTNKNGLLSIDEFYSHLQPEGEKPEPISPADRDVFKKLDLDNDNSLSIKELTAWESGAHNAEEAVRKLFASADKNKDDVLTADELDSSREEIAHDADADAQMYLTQWLDTHTERGEL